MFTVPLSPVEVMYMQFVSHISYVRFMRMSFIDDPHTPFRIIAMHGAIAAENGTTLVLRKLLKRRKIVNVSV